ncbi:MAG TPA: glycosyltransferase [Dongiaceae bacterium]|nr:glycosyltransferase [Dongiaceae bacterium]
MAESTTAPIRGPLLVVNSAAPTEAVGTTIVVRRLLEHFRREEVVFLARAANRHARLRVHAVHYPVVRGWAPRRGLRGERFTRVLAAAPMLTQGIAMALRYRPVAILGVFPDDGSLLTAWLLHRVTGIPLLAYFCDLYMEDRVGDGWEARLSRWLQPRVFRSARRLVVVNQGMADFYRERYGIDALVVPTCINQPIPAFAPPPPHHRPFRIGYSGNVNPTRIASLRALIEALGRDPGFEVRLFTPQPRADLERRGLRSGNASVEFVRDEATLVRRLEECDALFIPVAFDNGENTRDQLATSFGIKSYEYFLAQRPVVVHAPGDYFLTRFYRQHGCGIVVDDPAPAPVLEAFLRLREEPEVGAEMARRGLEALHGFEGSRVAAALRAEIGGLGR